MNNVIAIEDKKYPKLLKKIGKDAPEQLYYKGKYDKQIFKNCLAVVGSRKMTSYGQRITEQIVGEVARAGVVIVSGFMYGVDATAHKAALSAGGRTIAVMPCGIDLIHPEYQIDLYQEIIKNKGLIVSEYEGDFAPALWTYPKRNRIIAGLCQAVLIVEAALKSGSLITADLAKKYKRKIFAVPGPITSTASEGTNKLLKEGAILTTSAEDIFHKLGLNSVLSLGFTPEGPYALQKVQNLSPLEQRIRKQLQRESLEIDILARNLAISSAEIGTALSLMELKCLIKQAGNKYYVS